jgi:hypothetical protein
MNIKQTFVPARKTRVPRILCVYKIQEEGEEGEAHEAYEVGEAHEDHEVLEAGEAHEVYPTRVE